MGKKKKSGSKKKGAGASTGGASTVQTIKLQGHQGSVLCLAYPQQPPPLASSSILLSGSEDQTARLWDLKQQRAALCIPCDGAVTAVSFEPTRGNTINQSGDAEDNTNKESLGEHPLFAKDFTVFLAVDNKVLGYDLRKAKSPIVHFGDSLDDGAGFSVETGSTDEINQVAFSYGQGAGITPQSPRRKGLAKTESNSDCPWLAAADDAGQIRIASHWRKNPIPSELAAEGPHESITVLEHEQTSSATAASMITCAVFKPAPPLTLPGGKNTSTSNTSSILATGGTDCMVCLWDVKRPKKCLARQVFELTSSGANQVCNPPMINALAFGNHGSLLAAGLGDGSLAVFSVPKNPKALVPLLRMDEAHTGAIANVHFPQWAPSNQNDSSRGSTDRLLLTAGNDGMIVAWDLGNVVDEAGYDPATLFASGMKLPKSVEGDIVPTRTLFAISHQVGKPNWLLATTSQDTIQPATIFVADTSNDITGYRVPLAT